MGSPITEASKSRRQTMQLNETRHVVISARIWSETIASNATTLLRLTRLMNTTKSQTMKPESTG